MIDRNRYLSLCQKNAVFPGAVKVIYKDAEYYPVSYLMWFDKKGNPQNAAILHDVKSRSHMQAPLIYLFENEK